MLFTTGESNVTKFLGDSFSEDLLIAIKKCKKSITIISPYITMGAVTKLMKVLPKNLYCTVITQPPGMDYLTGAIEIDALIELKKNGFKLFYLHHLHAKIYIIDKSIAYLGSANFTANGWNGRDKGNVEDSTKVKLTKSDLDYLQERYILTSSKLEITDNLVTNLKKGLEKYKEFHQELKSLEKEVSISEQNVKILYAKYQPAVKGFPYNFRYSFSEVTGYLANKGKMDFVLKLGGSKEEPDGEIFVPYKIMTKILISSHLNKVKDWSFQISFDDKNKPYIRSTNFKTNKQVVIPLDSKSFKGKLKKRTIIYG